jgi:cold shock CspA family protein
MFPSSVKRFNGSKVIDFIESQSDGGVFINYIAVLVNGFRILNEGQQVGCNYAIPELFHE